jgi:hypothetical protein
VAGPFNRVEGDLEITLDIEGGAVKAAYVNSPLYCGFEQILIGKAPSDALIYTPRICGICSVSQSLAAAKALADAQGLAPAANGECRQNIILAAENIADHLTHFYMFFMPDFAAAVYAKEPWAGRAERFRAAGGEAQREFLPCRAEFMHIMGLLAGHWPHTLGLQPGGTTIAIGTAELARLAIYVSGFRRFLETVVFGDSLGAAHIAYGAVDRCHISRPTLLQARGHAVRCAGRRSLRRRAGRSATGSRSGKDGFRIIRSLHRRPGISRRATALVRPAPVSRLSLVRLYVREKIPRSPSSISFAPSTRVWSARCISSHRLTDKNTVRLLNLAQLQRG